MKLRHLTTAVVTALTVLLTPATQAEVTYEPSVGVIALVSVYDGDTIKLNITGWPAIIGRGINIRVNGVDTPDIRGYKCAKEKELGDQAKGFTQQFVQDGQITLHNLQRDKYFRILADVKVDGALLSTALMNAGLAYEYHGGTKQSWCRDTD